jgi:UDP-glucose 4-epimerase
MDGTILVTGAYGFLGRHVARFFSRKGYTVLGIGHGEWAKSEWEQWGLSEWKCSDVNSGALKGLDATPSTIVHCAGSGSVSFSIDDPIADFERTVVTTAHVLEYVRTKLPSCRVVYPSSASVYGTVEGLPIREDCQAAPISQYGVHKLMAEQMVASYSRQFGISTAIVRLFSVYGCGLRKQLLWDACRKFASDECVFMGTGDEVRDWLYVDDAAELLLAAAEHASVECPTVNGGSGVGVTVRQVLLHLSTCLSEASPAPVFSGAKRTGDPSRYIADIEASRSWGWQPKTSWEQGVNEYARWWKERSK